MPTNLDNISYIQDQLNLLLLSKHWYVYTSNNYTVYHHVNNDNTDNRLMVPLNFKFNFRKNLAFLYSSDNLKLKASDGNIFTNN
jgi:hypothetical protein